MVCNRCGNEISESASHCPHCGAAVGTAPPAPGAPAQPQAAQPVGQAQPGMPVGQPGVPVRDPNAKSKLVAGILGILIGSLGIHRFYLGYIGIGVLQIVVTVVTCGAGGLWGLIEGILILVGSTITTDADGRPLTD